MSKSTLDENEKKLLLQELRERLDFYTFQASEEQFDEKKVEVLVKQIKELESDSSAAERNASKQGMPVQGIPDFEAFLKYRAEKLADAERLAALNGEGKAADAEHPAASESGDIKKRSSIYARWAGSSRFVKAAAVGIAVLLVVGGSMGAVNAQKDGGLIQWLKKNIYGEMILVEPQKEKLPDGYGEDIRAVYHSPEELPEEYREYFVDLEGMKGLEGYEQEKILLSGDKSGWRLDLYWKSSRQDFLLFRIWSTEDFVIVQDRGFDDFENLYDKEVNGIELHVCKKPGDAGEKDVTVYFYYDNRKYIVDGKLPLEEMEEIAAEYAARVLEKNKKF